MKKIDWSRAFVWGFVIFMAFCIWNGIINTLK